MKVAYARRSLGSSTFQFNLVYSERCIWCAPDVATLNFRNSQGRDLAKIESATETPKEK